MNDDQWTLKSRLQTGEAWETIERKYSAPEKEKRRTGTRLFSHDGIFYSKPA